MRQLVLASLAMLAAPATGALASSADVDPERRVESILSRMTLEEKIDLLGGENKFGIRGVPRLGVPAMMTADGPFGVRTFTRTTVIPGGIGLAATWNATLA